MRIVPLWHALRPVGNSWLVRATVLIPFFGYLIIFNASIAQYFRLISEIEGSTSADFGLSVSPRLFQVYFGLCLLAGASMIYGYACPSIVKQFDSVIGFVAAAQDALGDVGLEHMEEEIKYTKYGSAYGAKKTHFQMMVDVNFSIRDAKREVNNALLYLYYAHQNGSAPAWRVMATTLYFFGFLLLLIPSIHVFIRVFSISVELTEKYSFGVLFQ
jgi:hypothetical protein